MLIDVIESYRESQSKVPYGGSLDELDPLWDDDLQEKLNDTKYGHEVIGHVEDGDACFSNEILQPALGSYIHAYEWAAITYLEDVEGIDIISNEQDGQFYFFAKGGDNILDELTEHVDLDQKTISKIESMNRAERRWMAHHKSGETLPDEVRAVRARLKEFLSKLFKK